MRKLSLVEIWLNSVSRSHSQSKATNEQYKRVWANFSAYIKKSAEGIALDFDASTDRVFGKKYADLINSWATALSQGSSDKKGITNQSINAMVGAVRSFFKYNNMNLAFIPPSKNGIVYHNRDIAKEEIVQIMSVSKIREKAFFAVMAQSGLRPHTIAQLRMKHLEPLDKIPCKIEVPQEIAKGKYGSYVTFIGADSIKYLKQYLATRTNLLPQSLLFCSHDNPNSPVNVKDMSRAFRLSARKLEESGALSYEVREGKPSELRLYNLRKFFRKYAIQMGFEVVEYMMGHIIKGVDGNYRPQDPEYYRELYAEKAMPFLRLETNTPTETEKTIEELKKQITNKDQKLQELEQKFTTFEPLFKMLSDAPNLEQLLKDISQGRYAKIESPSFTTVQVPRIVMKRLCEQAEAKGEEGLEFSFDQLKRMSLEEEVHEGEEPFQLNPKGSLKAAEKATRTTKRNEKSLGKK